MQWGRTILTALERVYAVHQVTQSLWVSPVCPGGCTQDKDEKPEAVEVSPAAWFHEHHRDS